jgi:hypothetical protein
LDERIVTVAALDTFRRVQIEASPQSNPGDFLGDIDKAVDCDESIRFPS